MARTWNIESTTHGCLPTYICFLCVVQHRRLDHVSPVLCVVNCANEVDANAVDLHRDKCNATSTVLKRASSPVDKVMASTQRLAKSLLLHLLGMQDQQRESPLRKYFIPWCVGRGLDLDLRVCPAAPAPAASGNLGLFKTMCSTSIPMGGNTLDF